jgi:hypothetical protein
LEKHLGRRMADKTFSPRLVALLGFGTAAMVLVIGFRLGAIGGPDPFGDTGRTATITTLALTFGTNLGQAFKQRESGAESIFYTWFFGSFAGLTGLASVYTILVSGYTIPQLVDSRSFLDSMELAFGTLVGSVAIVSGLVEASRIRYLKKAFAAFSEYLSQGILFGYATIKVTGDLGTGLFLSGSVVLALVVATKWQSVRNGVVSLLSRNAEF